MSTFYYDWIQFDEKFLKLNRKKKAVCMDKTTSLMTKID